MHTIKILYYFAAILETKNRLIFFLSIIGLLQFDF